MRLLFLGQLPCSVHFHSSRASSRGFPTLFHYLFVAKKVAKSAGLVLAAGRSIARFTKPLKTHSSALLSVTPSSSNTTRFTTADRGRRSARLERLRPLRRPGCRESPISSIFKLIEYIFFVSKVVLFRNTYILLPLLFPTALFCLLLPDSSHSTAQAVLASVSSRQGGTWGGKVKYILPQAFAIVMWRGDDRREEDRVRRQACEGPSE